MSDETENDISEAAISTIENLVKKCPAQAKDMIPNLLKLVRGCISYDPNYNDTGDDDVDMDDDGDDWGSEEGFVAEEEMGDDDTAWKVRKACTKVINALAVTCPGQLKKSWAEFIDLLVTRFRERVPNVKCDILYTFQNLVKASGYFDVGSSTAPGDMSMKK